MDVDNVDPSVIALTGAIGAEQGQPFTFNAALGRYAGIRAIEVWAGPDRINGVFVETTDNDSALAGKKDGPSRRFEFHVGERIVSLSLWGNGAGAYLGAIKFRTSEGREFDFGMTEWGRKKEYPMDPASGIMAGVFGRFEADGVRCMGFLFYRRVQNSYVTDFNFPESGLAQIAMAPRSVFEELVKNDTDSQQVITLSGSYSIAESNNISYTGNVTVESTFNMEMSSAAKNVETKVTASTKKGLTVKIATTHGGTNGFGSVRTQTVQYTVPVTVPARSAIRAEGIIFDTKANDVPFTANLHLVLDNGNTLIVPFKGFYNGVNSTQLSVDFNKV